MKKSIKARAIRFNSVLGIRIVEEKVAPDFVALWGKAVVRWPDHVGFWHFTSEAPHA